ncbi:hypothetical protein llap_7995 [Limosa lapponica baueri]|uniref:Uncharacterized protein n=1 Tax=Limosa lapponica baueri TaxID=1758121 RepID=A0A2I0U6V9_LIMLA|nr:hypothetical protein llap_7995 [Limosa lapponica baueri]
MGAEKRGDSGANIHADGKQDTGKMRKSHYTEAHGGCKERTLYPSGAGVVGVPDQEEEVDEAFYIMLDTASQSKALVPMKDFNHPDTCWKGNTDRHTQSRRFLQSTDDNLELNLAGDIKGQQEGLLQVHQYQKED